MRRPSFFAAIVSCVIAYAAQPKLVDALDRLAAGGLAAGRQTAEVRGSAAGWVRSAFADGEIRVGDELLAIDDVSLDEARICKGSKVSVSGRAVRAGKVFLDVALADGHVVKAVPMAEIRKSFRVVNA
jgi:hypothetical protein